jgi:putative Holliday junction resolvase
MGKKAGVLAIDHGSKRSGFAVVDGLRIAPRALDPWRESGGEEALFAHMEGLLADRDVSVLLVGLPLNMDGGEGPRSQEVRAFARRLGERFPAMEVVLHDERLSTKAAEELLRETGASRQDRRTLRDSFSALVVLRDWIAAGEPR